MQNNSSAIRVADRNKDYQIKLDEKNIKIMMQNMAGLTTKEGQYEKLKA